MTVKKSKINLSVGKLNKAQRKQHKQLVEFLTHKPKSDVLIGGKNCVCCRQRKWVDPNTGKAK